MKLASVSEQSLAVLLVDLAETGAGTSLHIDHPVSSQTVVVVGSTVACLNFRGCIGSANSNKWTDKAMTSNQLGQESAVVWPQEAKRARILISALRFLTHVARIMYFVSNRSNVLGPLAWNMNIIKTALISNS